MNRISNSKNLIKKISIFFLFFSIFVFTNIKTTRATILKFGLLGDPSACKDTLASCNIDSVLMNKYINDSKYKFVNTVSNLDGKFNIEDYKITDINMTLDNFIKERLYHNYGYFTNDIRNKFDAFDKDFDTYGSNLSADDKKSLDLLFVTMGSNITTQDKRFEIAKNVTKTLGNSTTSAFKYEDLQVATLTYYYLKIYKVLEQYILINKLSLRISPEANTKLITLKDTLRENIYTNLYKTKSILKADGCTTDGTHLELCDLFVSGKFKTDADGTAPDIEFNVMNDVNSLKLDASKYPSNANDIKLDTGVINADPGTRNDYADRANTKCDKAIDISWWFSINPNKSTDGCSFGALLINYIIQGINKLVDIVVNLVGSLFDWIYDKGVINFKEWVDGSGAYIIYKTIILSLIVSVMTFFVFYLIIRRLIDDDGDKMNKILPKLILTALFVYFSFTITGWVIDQSNIITIYLYRSMTHQDPTKIQPISGVFKNILSLDNGGANSDKLADNFGISIGTWDAIPYTAGQLVVSIVAVFVLIEGAILLLSRTIILLLCMIFSPIMLLPEGLSDLTDKYRKIVTDNFTGNILLGPVFMFLVLLAVKIGNETTKWLTQSGPTFNSGNVATPPGFLSGVIASVLVIVVLQLAISAAKNLSGSIGEKIGGTIGKFAGKVGGVAAGSAKWAGGKAIGGFMNNTPAGAKINDWISKGSTKKGITGSLFRGAGNITTQYGLNGEKKAGTTYADRMAETHEKASERGKARIVGELQKRIDNNPEDKEAKAALEKINNKIEDKKNTDFDRKNKSTAREAAEKAEQEKNNNSGGQNSAGAAPVVNSGGGNANPPLQGAGAQNIPKDENKTTMKTGESSSTFGRNSLTRQEIATDQNLTDSFKKATSFSERRNLVRQVANKAQTELNAGTYKKREGLINMRQEYKDKFERAETRKEDIEKQNAEIEAEKEKNGGYIPDAKNLDAQQSLKDRLKEKFSTKERMENGKIVKETSPELLEQRKADLKTTQRNIERKREDAYQEKVLEEAQMNANVNAANNNAPSFEETSVNK